tara:strand:- start:446 stop:625 length:180 start_codon:yes stop_codon:yes gene_type:complete
MPQISTDARPVILKNKKKGNRTLGLSGKHLSKKDKELYSKGWDRIFGNKPQKNYNRQKG